jgi:putative membrane protein insertion efficiency factor
VNSAEIVKAYILLMLRGYKALISPMLPNACRFVPTCSEYATEAIDRYGAFRGGLKALWRLLRCNPFSAAGYDPVLLPEHPAGTPDVQSICSHHSVSMWDGQHCPPAVEQNSFTPASRPDVWRC